MGGMDLPEIPEEAYRVGTDHVGGWECDPETSAAMVLEAAWPFLYAAALRHAADALGEDGGLDNIGFDVTPDFFGGIAMASARLNHMADAAASQP